MFWRAKLGAGQAAHSNARSRRYLILALLALGLIANPAGVITSADSPAASSSPAMLSTYLGEQATAVFARATRLASEMQQLYRVTRLDELKLAPVPTPISASAPRVVLCKDSTAVGSPAKSRI